MEWWKKYRPKHFQDVVGQPSAVKVLEDYVQKKNVPHAILLFGPSGTGKTTLARILAKELHCGSADFEEVNCAVVDEPLNAIRNIQRVMGKGPLTGPCRVWILDELQSFARGRFAQQALLKILEDMLDHVYFFLCTTDPNKIIPTVRGRCAKVPVQAVSSQVLFDLAENVTKKEGASLSKRVLKDIAEASNGSAREALVLLESVIGLPTEEEQLNAIVPPENKRQAFELVKVLLWQRVGWDGVIKLLKEADLSEPERFRHLVLTCANTEMLKGEKNAARAYMVVRNFESPWYECPESGLTAACYETWKALSGKG